ncbi:MAG: PTS system mannose/fructose/sorbose family transporter subunit IID [Erysipelothrix sp.]|nr:PTS system mannose/fructose/sorbose family transporter subunit IID [Erysipelothrix sp.]
MSVKLSKQTKNSAFWWWYHGNLTGFTHQHMQTFGFMCAMIPVIKELYQDDALRLRSLKTYSPFFNTEPQIGSMVVGIAVGLEEARANGADAIDDAMINGIRAGLMGPLAGIGDSLIPGTYIPILLSIALGFSTGGSVVGPLFYAAVYISTMTFFMKYVFDKGYELGGRAVDVVIGERATAFRESMVMLGAIVIGSLAASWIGVSTALQFPLGEGNPPLILQNTLNSIFPNVLSLLTVLFCWWLMTKRKMSPITVMLILVGIAFVGVLLGVFDPGLTY